MCPFQTSFSTLTFVQKHTHAPQNKHTQPMLLRLSLKVCCVFSFLPCGVTNCMQQSVLCSPRIRASMPLHSGCSGYPHVRARRRPNTWGRRPAHFVHWCATKLWSSDIATPKRLRLLRRLLPPITKDVTAAPPVSLPSAAAYYQACHRHDSHLAV